MHVICTYLCECPSTPTQTQPVFFSTYIFFENSYIVLRLHFITARKRSLGQGNIFTPVCHSVHGGSASVHAWMPPPRTRHPPIADTPWEQIPPSRHPPLPPLGADTPPKESMLGDMVNERAVRILLECNLVYKIFKNELNFNRQ